MLELITIPTIAYWGIIFVIAVGMYGLGHNRGGKPKC